MLSVIIRNLTIAPDKPFVNADHKLVPFFIFLLFLSKYLLTALILLGSLLNPTVIFSTCVAKGVKDCVSLSILVTNSLIVLSSNACAISGNLESSFISDLKFLVSPILVRLDKLVDKDSNDFKFFDVVAIPFALSFRLFKYLERFDMFL